MNVLVAKRHGEDEYSLSVTIEDETLSGGDANTALRLMNHLISDFLYTDTDEMK